MEIYLNIAEWGPNGQFGAEAGARHAFGKSARAAHGPRGGADGGGPARSEGRSARNRRPNVRRLAGIYEARAARFRGADRPALMAAAKRPTTR